MAGTTKHLGGQKYRPGRWDAKLGHGHCHCARSLGHAVTKGEERRKESNGLQHTRKNKDKEVKTLLHERPRVTMVMTRRWALGAVALVATVILRGATWQDQGITALKERSGDWMEGSRRHRGRVHGQRDPALLDAESAAAQAEKSMLKDGPAAEKATDDYTAARMRLTTLRTKLRDNTDVRKQLMLVEKRRQAQVAEAKQKRDDATKSVGTEDSTLQEAQKIAKHARRRERTSRQERSESEKAEAQGLALQQPAAALLKDSQRLNDQSNLVLDQSHSAQAKALAALDLKLAQNLAGRASKGMAEAKRDFAKAISDRKAAVADDAVSAHEVRQVAQVSLKTNKEQPALLHVLHGQMTGGAALHAVVNTDTNGVLNAEETLGECFKQSSPASVFVVDAVHEFCREDAGVDERTRWT